MSLQVWLPFNGNLNNQGLKSTKIVNYNTTFDTNGKIGQCCNIASGQYLGFDAANQNNHKYPYISIACWVYPTQSDSTERYVICCYENGGCGINLKNAKLGGQIYVGGYKSCYTPTTIALNTWHHICITYNGSKLCLYLNGELVSSLAVSGPITYHNTCPWQIGGNPGATAFGSNNFIGKINDLRMYDHALSAKEVEEIAKGLVLHYKLDDNINQTNWLLPNFETTIVRASGNTFTDYEYYTDLITNTETTYIVDFYAKGSVNAMGMDVYFRNSSGSAYALTSKQILTTDWEHYSLPLSGSPSSLVLFRARCYGGTANDIIYIRDMKLFSNNMPIRDTTVYDSSGYNNNGTIVGSLEVTTPSPRYSYATKFNGSSHIKKIDFIYNSNIWSVSLWYLKPTNPTAYECLFCFSQGDGGDSNKKIAACPNSGRIWYKGESGSSSISQLKINEWTNLIMTCNGTTVTIYQNGNSIGTFSASTALTGRTDLVIGARASAENATNTAVPFTGEISDFRIYATALTETQIKELYNTSATIDNKGNGYAREEIEDSNLNITKTGQFHNGELLDNDDYTTASITKIDKQLKVNNFYEY